MDQLTATIRFLLDDQTINAQIDRLTKKLENFRNQFTFTGFFNEFDRLNQITLKFREQIEALEKKRLNLSFFGQDPNITLNQIERLNDRILNYFAGNIDHNFLRSLSKLGIELKRDTNGTNLYTQIIEGLRNTGRQNDNVYLKQILEPLGMFHSSIINIIRANEEEYEAKKKFIEQIKTITSPQENIIRDLQNNWKGIQETFNTIYRRSTGNILEFMEKPLFALEKQTENFLSTNFGQATIGMYGIIHAIGTQFGLFNPNKKQNTLEENVSSIAADVSSINKRGVLSMGWDITKMFASKIATLAPALGLDEIIDRLVAKKIISASAAETVAALGGATAVITAVFSMIKGISLGWEGYKETKKDFEKIKEINNKYIQKYESGELTAQETEKTRKKELAKNNLLYVNLLYNDPEEIDRIQKIAQQEKKQPINEIKKNNNVSFVHPPVLDTKNLTNKILIQNHFENGRQLKKMNLTINGETKNIDFLQNDVQINNITGVNNGN